MQWKEAVDEAGHVIVGTSVGINIVSVIQDAEGNWRTNPAPVTGVTHDKIYKFQLAGVAAQLVVGCWTPRDVYQIDMQTVFAEMTNPRLGAHPPLEANKADGLIMRYIDENIAELSKPEIRAALEKCACYLQANNGLSGSNVTETIKSFFSEQEAEGTGMAIHISSKGERITYGIQTRELTDEIGTDTVRRVRTPYFRYEGQEVMPQELRDAWQKEDRGEEKPGYFMETAREYLKQTYPQK